MLTILAISYFLLFILFGQSSIDKIINWKENYTWLQDYFSKTFLNRFTKFNLLVITILELASALMSFYSIILIKEEFKMDVLGKITEYNRDLYILDELLWTNILCAITLLFLFIGQRIAKDYIGAVRIIPYFILILILNYLVFSTFVI